MGITRADVQRIADLAALRLDDNEAERLAEELSGILEHVDALREVDTAGVAPPGADGRAPLRADRPDTDRLAQGPAVMAPEWVDGFFTVPRLASHAGEGEGAGEVSDARPRPRDGGEAGEPV